jgi:hypothetical protein
MTFSAFLLIGILLSFADMKGATFCLLHAEVVTYLISMQEKSLIYSYPKA